MRFYNVTSSGTSLSLVLDINSINKMMLYLHVVYTYYFNYRLLGKHVIIDISQPYYQVCYDLSINTCAMIILSFLTTIRIDETARGSVVYERFCMFLGQRRRGYASQTVVFLCFRKNIYKICIFVKNINHGGWRWCKCTILCNVSTKFPASPACDVLKTRPSSTTATFAHFRTKNPHKNTPTGSK